MKTRRFCYAVGEKLINPDFVVQISQQEENRFHGRRLLPWDARCFDFGYPALVLLFAELYQNTKDSRWLSPLHVYLERLIHEVKHKGCKGLSLFFGLTGTCFACYGASLCHQPYVKLHEGFHHLLLAAIHTPPTSMQKIDIIHGSCGILSYLLLFHQQPQVCDAINVLADHMIQQINFKLSSTCIETGMAHGIAGYLAALAKAFSRGILQPQHMDAMRQSITWLQQARQKVGSVEQVWPRSWNHLEPQPLPLGFYYDAWSHGAPGILNALCIAADALQDKNLLKYCLEACNAIATRVNTQHSSALTPLCYGSAGVAAILHRMALRFSSPFLAKSAASIASCIAQRFDPALPFGIRCLPPTDDLQDHVPIDNVGFLSGVIGVALALLYTTSKKTPLWHTLLLL